MVQVVFGVIVFEEEAEGSDLHCEQSGVVRTGVRLKVCILHPMLFVNVIGKRPILVEVIWKTVVRHLQREF